VFAAKNESLWRSDDLGQKWILIRQAPMFFGPDGALTGMLANGTNLFIMEHSKGSPSADFYDVSYSSDLGQHWLYTQNPQRGGPFAPSPTFLVGAVFDSLFVSYLEKFPTSYFNLFINRGYASPGIVTLSSASYGSFLAGESLASAFGLDLSSETRAATAVPLPTELAGVSVAVKDSAGVERISPLLFVSPAQINFQIPPGTANGNAQVKVLANGTTVRSGEANVSLVAPGLFTANMNGVGVPAALLFRVKADGSSQYEPVAQLDPATNQFVPKPIDFGAETDRVYLILFGAGVRNHSELENLSVTFPRMQTKVRPEFAGAQGSFVGLDQINLPLPRSLAGSGDQVIYLSVPSYNSNFVTVNFK
jgi:uncharacterized protein (TIGR03437 family)